MNAYAPDDDMPYGPDASMGMSQQHQDETLMLAMIASRTDPGEVQAMISKLTVDVFTSPTNEQLLQVIARACRSLTRDDEMSWPLLAAKLTEVGTDADAVLNSWEEALDRRDVATARLTDVYAWADVLNTRAQTRTLEATIRKAMAGLQQGQDADTARSGLIASLLDQKHHTSEDSTYSVLQLMEEAEKERAYIAKHGGKPELSSGSKDIDDAFGVGTSPGKVTVIAARPAHGKTVFATDIARAWLKQGVGVLFFSIEMSPTDMWHRMMAAHCSIPLPAFNKATFTPKEQQQLDTYEAPLAQQWNDLLVVNAATGLTAEQMVTRIEQQRLLWERQGITPGGFIVDYIQRISSSRPREEQRVTVERSSKLLTNVAKETGMHMLMVSQLNRAGVGEKPSMAHLRDSGQLEQDADNIVLLYRDEVDNHDSPRAGEADFIVAKARKGIAKTITRGAQMQYQRFVDLASSSDARRSETGHTGGWN